MHFRLCGFVTKIINTKRKIALLAEQYIPTITREASSIEETKGVVCSFF